MFKKLVISLVILISLVLSGYGVYKVGTIAYAEGIEVGITAVVEQCAQPSDRPWTFYNGKTGDGMVCEGGHVGRPSEEEKTPEKALPEAPRAGIGRDGTYHPDGKSDV